QQFLQHPPFLFHQGDSILLLHDRSPYLGTTILSAKRPETLYQITRNGAVAWRMQVPALFGNYEWHESHEWQERGGQMAKEMLFKEESYRIMGACFEVYNELGSGFLEAV
ncbi:MAG TPA: hypothetical protein VLI39_14675, partial [Sedimentisphaerales bacterium]|nr:hypothetical protein [Sedimentisphaerales bacterium]